MFRIISRWTHQFSSAHWSQATLSSVSTWIGDGLGILGILNILKFLIPKFFFLLSFFFFLSFFSFFLLSFCFLFAFFLSFFLIQILKKKTALEVKETSKNINLKILPNDFKILKLKNCRLWKNVHYKKIKKDSPHQGLPSLIWREVHGLPWK